ncbi:hypothetical protein SAMN04488117_12024 [Celeribacter baekdonensis]|uniref:Uncharacterized protein n=1 Tax=Celeribacter baekdonensis TaxID=875171 RepID=A0A1G7U5X1_9RHOB|nr:hypothetical protein [Celeribacter baekdonensis]SDG43042.1 hypothetical protein SAMN04488117_12024 [Celeribacter baekdonensis]
MEVTPRVSPPLSTPERLMAVPFFRKECGRQNLELRNQRACIPEPAFNKKWPLMAGRAFDWGKGCKAISTAQGSGSQHGIFAGKTAPVCAAEEKPLTKKAEISGAFEGMGIVTKFCLCWRKFLFYFSTKKSRC